jgi:hypothetical protein
VTQGPTAEDVVGIGVERPKNNMIKNRKNFENILRPPAP